jgi:vacuolar-type H+-ATPase subunit H
MNVKVKKGLVISLSVFVVFFAALLALPYAFRGKILTLAKAQVNGMLNATVDFDALNISFIRSFPNASLRFANFRVVGLDEFKEDTLLFSENVDLVLNLRSLFSDTGYEVRKLQFNNSRVFVHVLANGKPNWDIMKKDSSQKADTTDMSFNLKLKDFVVDKANIIYWDEKRDITAELNQLNHRTTGDLTADSSLLVTKTTVDTFSFWMDGIEYVSKANAELNADIDANLNDMIFTFSRNESCINAILFSFAGWVKSMEKGWDMDLILNAEKVDFKAILSMIPAIYAESFEAVEAGGDVDMSGFIKGMLVDDYYPAFNFGLKAKNGWFQYPGLPKSLQNIDVDGQITNPGKTLDETVFDISRFSFVMGGNPFLATMRISYPMSDPELIAKAVGKIDLGMIKEVYPLSKDTKMSGLLDVKLDMAGRMSYYEANQYDRFQFAGKLDISNMLVSMKDLPQDISISNANLVFNNRYVDLTSLNMKIGRNDLVASGKIENFLAYALSDKTLKGVFNLKSEYFNVTDFMSSSESKSTEKTESQSTQPKDSAVRPLIEIPRNIDFGIQANIKELIYEKMTFANAKGQLLVVDGNLKFQNVGLQAFGGSMVMNGMYSASTQSKPAVDFDLAINEVVFTEIFSQVEILQKFAPIFQKAAGKFSTKLSFNSLLNNDMMPDLLSVVGKGSLSTKSVGLRDVPVLNALASGLKRTDLVPMVINNLGLLFEIKDGKLLTKPFSFKVADVSMHLGGATGLDKTIDYAGKVQLPDRLNLGRFSTVNVKIGGTFTKPKVELDLMSTVNTLVDEAKSKLEAEATKQVDAAKDKAIEEARKQKENAVREAQEQADKLRAEAQKTADKLIEEARIQGDQLIAKATNPVTKKIAETAAKKLLEEARKKASELNAKADSEAKKLIQQASDMTI